MVNSKKKKGLKKAAKSSGATGTDSSSAAAASNTETFASSSVAARVEKIEARCTVEYATELEAKFRLSYPPEMDYDKYLNSLSNKQAKKVDSAYSKVSSLFNQGVALAKAPTGTPGISRWHLVIDKMMDAIAVIVEQAENAFLTTVGTDRRTLLSRICVTVSQCRGKALDTASQVAWAKVAIAADPTYYNAYNHLSMGHCHGGDFAKSLEAAEKAQRLLLTSENVHDTPTSTLPMRLKALQKIVNEECKVARKEMTKDRSGAAFRWWQEMSMERPARVCAFCLWPGDMKCANCRTVFYCSRDCQRFDYKEHKEVCIAPSSFKKDYPAPNFAAFELCSDAHWNFFQKQKETIRESTVLIAAANNCHAGAVKRALMNGDDVNTLGDSIREYSVHMVALRREPDNALESMKALIDHGACPNVIRGDGKHLLAICRERAKWIDDTTPSMENTMHRMRYSFSGSNELERLERQESEQLVEIVTCGIRNHKLCRLCKAKKQNNPTADAHLHGSNLTDDLLERLASNPA
jgi:hypothetical protein